MVPFVRLIAVAFVSAFLTSAEYYNYEEKRIDSYDNYLQYQDIYKVFSRKEKQWLFGFNYKSPHTEGKSCVYFEIESVEATGMNYSSNFWKNNSQGRIEYIGGFDRTPVQSDKENMERPKPNHLKAHYKQNASITMNFTLIYSNYTGCSIFRVPFIEEGNGCMVLLTDSIVDDGLTGSCRSIYNHACNKTHTFHPIFQKNCTQRNATIDSASAV
uniref:Putative licpodalin-4 1 n=1 Tax=Amblyomma cajennense TaxID=34607 RepID=A0A023FU37_AMBCJ